MFYQNFIYPEGLLTTKIWHLVSRLWKWKYLSYYMNFYFLDWKGSKHISALIIFNEWKISENVHVLGFLYPAAVWCFYKEQGVCGGKRDLHLKFRLHGNVNGANKSGRHNRLVNEDLALWSNCSWHFSANLIFATSIAFGNELYQFRYSS